jgi:hypothetical protein
LVTDENSAFTAFGITINEEVVAVDADEWEFHSGFGNPGNIAPLSGHSTTFSATGSGDGMISATYTEGPDTLVDTAYVIVGNIKGDVNIDDVVNIPDAILCLKIWAELLSPGLYQNWAADFYNDGTVDAGDALGILNKRLEDLFSKTTSLAYLTGSGPVLLYTKPPEQEHHDLLHVPVFVENRDDVCGMDLILDYNTSAYSLLSTVNNCPATLLFQNLYRTEFPKIAAVNLDGLKEDNGQIIDLVFQRKKDTGEDLNLNIKSVGLYDQKGRAIATQVELNRIVQQEIIPAKFVLHQNYPNPFNPSTTIRYDLAEAGQVSINIFNANGQIIYRLLSENQEAGSYEKTWHGMDKEGHPVASGVYFYKIRLNNNAWSDIKKMLLVK